jgi:hypothetical protein
VYPNAINTGLIVTQAIAVGFGERLMLAMVSAKIRTKFGT